MSHPLLRHRRRSRGLSSIESLLGMAVVATAVSQAGPAMTKWRSQQAVVQAAAVFETDIHFARSQAAARHETLRLAIEDAAGDGTRCYVLHTGPRGACTCDAGTGQARCTAEHEALRVGLLAAVQPVRLETSSRQLAFDPLHGTVTPATTVRFTAPGSTSVHQVVSILGRVRSCTSGGRLAGYLSC